MDAKIIERGGHKLGVRRVGANIHLDTLDAADNVVNTLTFPAANAVDLSDALAEAGGVVTRLGGPRVNVSQVMPAATRRGFTPPMRDPSGLAWKQSLPPA